MKLVMGLFSKQPSADSLYESFGKLPEEEQKLFLAKFQEQEPVEEETDEKEEVEETTENQEDDGGDTNVDTKVETKPSEEKSGDDKFAEMFKKLQEDSDKKFNSLREEFEKKFEDLTKKSSEKKPFGLTEQSKEYKATKTPKQTSNDLFKKYFS
jgi:hypothetical protein